MGQMGLMSKFNDRQILDKISDSLVPQQYIEKSYSNLVPERDVWSTGDKTLFQADYMLCTRTDPKLKKD